MTSKLDYKKEYKDLYLPPKKPVTITVPPISFIMLDGKGDPNSREYQNAVSALYSLSFTIKMSKMGSEKIDGYFEYVVPPLEGLWSSDGPFDFNKRDKWTWTSMIRQPEFVTEDVFQWAVESVHRKKPEVDVSKVEFVRFDEGMCVQMMHIGPYATEPATVEIMQQYMEENGLIDVTGDIRRHHEIYLSDPRKTKPENLKTVLRHPVE
ncbi:GyrI-like domain-containing protein [Christensenellaceae bacterium OttesenSCG-928-K19]|nr:GyrI-like domain-containing protein [Christensenellaceae bacterium OttesenSCG-928-K19]